MIQRLRQVGSGFYCLYDKLQCTGPSKKRSRARVLDGESKPLPGVTVLVKGKSTATTTNENGNYTIERGTG